MASHDQDQHDSESGPAPGHGAAPEAAAGATDSVHLFVEDLREAMSKEDLKAGIRITPHGIFVQETSFPKLIEGYQRWLQKKTAGQVVKSADKCVKRLFGSHTPPQSYLVEGKQCLLGYLVPCPIQQPQKYNLPFYLGSLLDTQDYLHPRDPLLAELKHVEVAPKPLGVEIRFLARRRNWRVNQEFLKQFSRLAGHSRKLLQIFPKLTTSLRETLKAVMRIAGRARPVHEKQPLLVPARYRERKDLDFLQLGALILVSDGRENLIDCYETRGGNFDRLLRTEIANLRKVSQRGRIGAFEIPRGRSRFLGTIQVERHYYQLHSRAFMDFISAIPLSPSLRENFAGRFTVLDCLKKLSYLFAAAEKTDQKQISAFLGPERPKGARYYMKDDWIFMMTGKDILTSCINKRAAQRRQRKRR